MAITMTWADGALALLLGVIGSILAAYLYARAPRLIGVVATKWAQRSDRAAGRRLTRLQARFDEIEKLRDDISKYVGWIGSVLGACPSNRIFVDEREWA